MVITCFRDSMLGGIFISVRLNHLFVVVTVAP
jgi:hypothetical protein